MVLRQKPYQYCWLNPGSSLKNHKIDIVVFYCVLTVFQLLDSWLLWLMQLTIHDPEIHSQEGVSELLR